MSNRESIEINKVANGYIARPAHSAANPVATDFSEIHVFETFTALAGFLQGEFEGPRKKGVTQ